MSVNGDENILLDILFWHEADSKKVIDFIKDGAGVSACDSFGRTPPHYTVEFGGGREVVEPLLEDSSILAFGCSK